ncbi:MAG TPA: SDR family oxidoreductase [Roseiarcus sp.]|jgi:NAD(P)-dependent dehydrogenase (short-subunit alcohol dehydrogenase family)
MKGKTIVATGATSGIGEAAILALAGQGARIVFIARDEARARATMQKLEATAPGLGHRMHLADLSSMAEARKVGAAIAASEPRIDVLINNAGALFSHRQVTPEGLELTFALNHMAYFALTEALRDKLIASAPARIVSTSSSAHQGVSLDFNDLQSAKSYNGLRVYGRSKLANILFTRELARRLAGTGVTANCLHPGAVATRFGYSSGGLIGPLIRVLRLSFISPEQGADTIVYLASSPEAANMSGGYFVKRKMTEPSAAARDDAAAKKLREASEALAGEEAQKERAAG